MKSLKHKGKALVATLLAASMLITFVGCGTSQSASTSSNAESTVSIKGGFQGSIDAWPAYYAVHEGLQNAYGINLKMEFFDSGMPMAQTVPSHELSLLCNGSVPCLMAAMRYQAPIIGIATNESSCNAVVARADSNVFSVTNDNGTFGSADQVKGKTILVTTISSAHYALSKYLESLGLTESDVTIKNLEPSQAIKSFETGDGDFLVLWAPFLYRAYEKGWQKVADGEQVGAATYLLYQADPEFIKEDPETLAKLLCMFNEGVQRYQTEGTKLVPEIQGFFQDFAAMEVSESDVKLDIETHEVYTIEEQLAYLSEGHLTKDLTEATNFFVAQNKFTKEEGQDLIDNNIYIDTSILEKAMELQNK